VVAWLGKWLDIDEIKSSENAFERGSTSLARIRIIDPPRRPGRQKSMRRSLNQA